MVSNVLDLTQSQLVERLADFKVRYAEDAEYQELRKMFPADWPM